METNSSFFVRHGLVVRLAAAFIVTLLAVKSTVGFFAYRSHMAELAERHLKMIETAVVISIDPLRAPTVRDMEFIGRRFVMQQIAVGGIVVDENNRNVGQFGIQLPARELVEAQSKSSSRVSLDGNFLDLRFNGTRLGLGYDLIMRIDRAPIKTEALHDVYSKTALTAGLYAAGMLAVFLLVLHYAARPLARLRDGVRLAFADFENPDKYLFNWRRRDEIGELSSSIDRLFRNLSASRQDQTEATRTFLSHGPVPVITLRAGRALEFANPAALELFGKEGLGDMIASRWPVVIQHTASGEVEQFVGEALDDARNARIVNIGTANGVRQVQMSHIRHRAHLEERSLTVVQFLDVTRFVKAAKRYKEQYDEADAERRRLNATTTFQAFQLDGLSRDMRSTSHAPDLPGAGEETTTQWPVRYVRTWHARAKTAGIVSTKLDIDELPGVAVAPYLFYEAIDRVFHVLLSAVGEPGADVAVNTFTDGKSVEFSFAAKTRRGEIDGGGALIGVQEAHLRDWLEAIGATFSAIEIHGPVITATVKFPSLGATQFGRQQATAV